MTDQTSYVLTGSQAAEVVELAARYYGGIRKIAIKPNADGTDITFQINDLEDVTVACTSGVAGDPVGRIREIRAMFANGQVPANAQGLFREMLDLLEPAFVQLSDGATAAVPSNGNARNEAYRNPIRR